MCAKKTFNNIICCSATTSHTTEESCRNHKMSGYLYLIPLPIGDNFSYFNNNYYKDIILSIDYFIVEDIRTARRFLKKICKEIIIDDLSFRTFNEHNNEENLHDIQEFFKKGGKAGLMSEAGCPAVADPGSEVVMLAHKNNVNVLPLIGPSSILLALMASGLNGQKFMFNGYLPVNKEERKKRIKHLENISKKENSSQIFIETPYRNNHMLNDLINVLENNTLLSISANLDSESCFISTKFVCDWKKSSTVLDKVPAIFILLAK